MASEEVAGTLQSAVSQGDPMSRSARVIALANQKGGVAKTTTTVNLAVALREHGRRVLVVDLDPQSNLSMSQGIDVESLDVTMFDVLVHGRSIADVVHVREVDVAAAGIELAGAELALSSMMGRERALQRALAPIKGAYDDILIDTPPSLGLLSINAMVASDGVIVPVQCEYLSLRGLAQLQNTLAQVREHLNPNVDILGILPTMFDSRTVHGREALDLLRDSFGPVVFNTRIGKTVRFAEAPVSGKSVLAYDPSGQGARWYRRLALEVMARESNPVRIAA